MIIITMGVSGSGKTVIGTLLAKKAGMVFADADDFHSAANKQKMAEGHPLDDDDRQPWLETLHTVLKGWSDSGAGGVMACSALKEKYRLTLTSGLPSGSFRFVLLELSPKIIAQRMAARKHEFMNPNLLGSQLATLEIPKNALHIVNDRAPEEVVQEILSQLHLPE
jgi:gluconokinase